MKEAGTDMSHLVHRRLDEVTWSGQAVALMRDPVTFQAALVTSLVSVSVPMSIIDDRMRDSDAKKSIPIARMALPPTV